MKLAVCDDDPRFVRDMMGLLRDVAPDDKTLVFGSGLEFLAYTGDPGNKLDVLFLDMRMPHLDGLDTAAELRLSHPDVQIIVVTAFPEYARKCYEVYPFSYMEKPVDPGQLEDCLARVRTRLHDDDFVLLTFKDGFTYVPVYGIHSIERVGFNLVFTMDKERHAVSTAHHSLAFYERALTGKGFFRIHRDIMVHFKYVRAVRGHTVTMNDGHTFEVSRRRKPALMDSLTLWRSHHVW